MMDKYSNDKLFEHFMFIIILNPYQTCWRILISCFDSTIMYHLGKQKELSNIFHLKQLHLTWVKKEAQYNEY